MTRAEGMARLRAQGWTDPELSTMSDALLDWLATDTPYRAAWVYPGRRDASGEQAPAVDDREVRGYRDEAGGTRADARKAILAARRAQLAEEGRMLAPREGLSERTLAALGVIRQVGTGRCD